MSRTRSRTIQKSKVRRLKVESMQNFVWEKVWKETWKVWCKVVTKMYHPLRFLRILRGSYEFSDRFFLNFEDVFPGVFIIFLWYISSWRWDATMEYDINERCDGLHNMEWMSKCVIKQIYWNIVYLSWIEWVHWIQ